MSDRKDDTAIEQQTPSWGILEPPGPKPDKLQRFKFREIKSFLIPAGLYMRIVRTQEYLLKDGVDLKSERDFLLSMLDAMVTQVEYTIFMKEKEKADAKTKAEAEAGQPAQGQDGDRPVPDGEVRTGSDPEVPTPEPKN